MSEKTPDEMTEGELARYYEDHMHDDDFWDNFKPSSIKLPEGKAPSTVFTMRIDPVELERIARTAHAAGMNASEFVRRACLAAIEDQDRLRLADKAKAAKEVQKKIQELAEAASRL
jgi:hypothetical protein